MGRFLDAATGRWRQAGAPAFEPAARREVERLCAEVAGLVQAQLEALRLEPGNQLYRRNLLHLLTVPYKEFMGRELETVGGAR